MTHALKGQCVTSLSFGPRPVGGYLISVELKAPNSQLLIAHLGFPPTDRRPVSLAVVGSFRTRHSVRRPFEKVRKGRRTNISKFETRQEGEEHLAE